MNIGIFSDIHDNIDKLNHAFDVFQKEQVDQAIFGGDLVSPFTLKFLKSWPFPIKAVFGNNEGDTWGIARRLKKYALTNFEYPEKGFFWEMECETKKIAVFHGHLYEVTQLMVESGKYDLVVTGHTHEPHIKTVKSTLWINPGCVCGVSENEKVTTATVALYNSTTNQARIIPI